jgi:hypothetical protein
MLIERLAGLALLLGFRTYNYRLEIRGKAVAQDGLDIGA